MWTTIRAITLSLGVCGSILQPSATVQGSVAGPTQRFTARAEAVRVDVLVTNRGRSVAGLTSQDFLVRDQGVLQRVDLVGVETLPVNVIAIVETSVWGGSGSLARLTDAAGALLSGLHPQDRIALLSFSNQLRLLSPLTADHAAIRAMLSTMQPGLHSVVRDALFAGLALREADPGRTVVLLFSRGRDTVSWLTPRRVLDAANRTDAVVYTVTVKFRGITPFDHGKFLDEVAVETGGRVIVAEADRDLGGIFVDILTECRGRYVLSYIPTGVAANGWHRLEVSLKGRQGQVTARRGYFVE